MNQQAYRKLISGRSTGLAAAILRLFLAAPALIYSTIVWLRNFLYSKGWLKIYRANARVFSIGNITTGGTGKTPLVIWLCRFLQRKQIQCAVLTRGYKTYAENRASRTDEPAILTESCPDAKIIVNPDRVEAAAEAVNEFGAKVLIMDDGFQHRRLHRDLDIVTIDATQPFGYSRVLPAGLLREPVASLKRADAVVITRCDQTAESELSELEEKLRLVNPNMTIARSIHAAVCIKYMDSCLRRNDSIEELRNKKIFAFCGIGNPNAFLNTITELGANLVGSGIYNDHYHYTDSDIDDIHGQANGLEADLILTTQKDWTRTALLTSVKKDIPFACLVIELKFISGEDKITHLIEYASAGKMLKTKED